MIVDSRARVVAWHPTSMKRYRVLKQQFDFRSRILRIEIDPTWEPAIKAQWEGIHADINAGLAPEYGARDIETKAKNFMEIGVFPLSVIAYHNRFLTQARLAFIMGAYYPALTGACSLGERILNYLVLGLRDAFRSSPEYKGVARKDSFDNWEVPISTLEAWGVWAPEVAARFRALAKMRNRAIHFDPTVEGEDRARALEALTALQEIIARQFSVQRVPVDHPGRARRRVHQAELRGESVHPARLPPERRARRATPPARADAGGLEGDRPGGLPG